MSASGAAITRLEKTRGPATPCIDEDTVWISADGLPVVFASNIDSYDLYAASRASRTSAFGAPALVAELATTFVEGSPALSADELEIFFISGRHRGEMSHCDAWAADVSKHLLAVSNQRQSRLVMSTKLSLAALAFATSLTMGACKNPSPPPPPARAVRAVPVTSTPLAQGRRYSGSLLPRAQVELSFRVAGRVDSLLQLSSEGIRRPVQEGDAVKRGDVLATLDPRDLRLQTSAAAATLATARTELAAAEKARGYVEIEVARARKLVATGAIARAEADQAEAAFDAARTRVDAARSQRDARAAQAGAAQRVLEDARLTSPIDGIVARRTIDVGETASPGRTVFTIIDDREVRVTFAVPDTRVASLHLGDDVPIRVEAMPDRVLHGKITKIDPLADPALRTFAAEVTVANADRELRAGVVASVELRGDAAATVLRVPLAAVLRGPDGDELQVWVLGADGASVARRVVVVADLIGDDVVIERGLALGERVVVDGAGLLHDGAVVDVRP